MNSSDIMSSTPLAQNLICQWWQRCGAILGDLTPELQRLWLTSLSEVIRFYRLSLSCSENADKQLFLSLCRISLAKTRPFLTRLLISGCIAFTEMQQLQKLEADLELSLENKCA